MFARDVGPSTIEVLRCKTTRKVVLLLTVAFGALRCNSQTAQPTTIPGAAVTVQADEVSLDLVVHDKKQRPVLDLKPDEVAITDNGDPVKITSLRLVGSGSENDHLITLVFDRLSATLKKTAAEVAGKILKATPESEFSLAVLRIQPGRLGLLQGFTSDRNALQQAINAAVEPKATSTSSDLEKRAEASLMAAAETGTDPSGRRVSARDRSLARTLDTALRDSARIVQDQHTQAYLSELLALMGSQRGSAGRKVLIYFTEGTYADSRGQEMTQSVIGAANRANISIYCIDLTALAKAEASGDSRSDGIADLIGRVPTMVVEPTNTTPNPSTPSSGTDYTTWGEMMKMTAANSHDRNPARELAEGTGGSYVDGTHSLLKPLQRMIQDMTTYYEAFYVPALNKYDGKFRPVFVKPLRKGIKIQAQEGYFALPPDASSGIQPFELPLLNMLGEAKLPTDVAFRESILRLGDLPNRDGNTLAIEVPLSGVEIRQDGNTNLYSAQVSFWRG